MTTKKLEDTLKALRNEYQAKLPQELARIDSLWAAFQGPDGFSHLSDFQRAVHKLSGNAGAFGFTAITQAARPLDVLLIEMLEVRMQGRKIEIDKYRAYIEKHLAAVRAGEQRPDAAPEQDSDQQEEALGGDNKLVYLVEDDESFAKLLEAELQAYGYPVKIFNRVKGLPQAIRQQAPAAVIMDVMLEEGRLAGPRVMFQIQKSRPLPLPLIFISARTDMEARLAAVRANGDAYFVKPFDIGALVNKLEELTQPHKNQHYKILIVDDSTEYGEKYAKTLQQAGMQAKVLAVPMRCLDALERFQADLVLINTQLSGFSGLELAMVIRQQEKHGQLPIVFFAQQFDQTISRAALIGIGDDYLSENIAAPQLVATITNRIKSARQQQGRLQQLRNKDPLTEVFNRHYFIGQLQQSGTRVQADKPLLILYISLDNYWGVEKIQGLRASDALVVDVANFLKTCSHTADILARLSESTFALLSSIRTLDEGRQLAERIRAHLENHLTESDDQRVLSTCSIGIGIHHNGDGDFQKVLSDAAHACGVAQKGGGNRLHLHESAQIVKTDNERQDAVRRAIEQSNFVLAFQPITTLHGLPGAYYDALLRMRLLHKQENVPTAEFLEIAERHGLMPEIDRWVVAQISRRLDDRRQQQSNLINFFVRISKASLQDPEFLPWLVDHLAGLSFPTGTLIFDISQEVALTALQATEEFVEKICDLGCRFALRDFDGQAGALQLLKRLEINLIKLHRELMQDISDDAGKTVEVDRIVRLAHENGISVVAPFVEDVTTLSLLWQHELDYITGYFIQPPGESLDYDFEQA